LGALAGDVLLVLVGMGYRLRRPIDCAALDWQQVYSVAHPGCAPAVAENQNPVVNPAAEF
jgi:hypothetical protein